MDKAAIEMILKYKMELFKIYSFFLVGLITGEIGFLLKYISDKEPIILGILVIGFIALVFVGYLFTHMYIQIIKLLKMLKL